MKQTKIVGLLFGAFILGSLSVLASPHDKFKQVNLTANQGGVARNFDSRLINPWGIAFQKEHLYVAVNGAGLGAAYTPFGQFTPFNITIPMPGGASGPAKPTGIVFNSLGGFVLTAGTNH